MCRVKEFSDEYSYQIINIVLHIFHKKAMTKLDKQPSFNFNIN